MNRQSGFTLIEIMIAGLIGVFIISGLFNLFISINRTVTLSESMGRNQETGRFAMDYMTRYIRLAGYTEDLTKNLPPIFVTSGNNESAIDCSNIEQKSACAMNNPEDEPIRGDRLSIPFFVGSDENDESRACTGTIIGGPDNGEQNLVTVFWVSNEPETSKELRCRTYDNFAKQWLDKPVSIINNVEKFEFQIGIAASESDRYVSKYISIDTLENDESVDVNSVRSIRIAILTTSEEDHDIKKINSTKKERKYSLLDAPTLSITDGNLRNIFINTIELPNMINEAGL